MRRGQLCLGMGLRVGAPVNARTSKARKGANYLSHGANSGAKGDKGQSREQSLFLLEMADQCLSSRPAQETIGTEVGIEAGITSG